MDGDDISLPERFQRQYDFMEANEEVVVCGTLYKIIGTEKICDHPSEHDEIKVKLLSGCYIAHPTVMFRAEFIAMKNIKYDEKMEPAEDYELWSRLVFICKIANLNEVLLEYRVHGKQTSSLRSENQGKISREIRNRMLQKIIPELNFKFHPFDLEIQLDEKEFQVSELQKIVKTIDHLIIKNNEKIIFDQKIFSKLMDDEKEYLCSVFSKKSNRYSLYNLINVLCYFPSFFVVVGMKGSIIFIGRSLLFRLKNGLFKKNA